MGRQQKHAPASRKRSSSSRRGTPAAADPPPSPQPTPAKRIFNSLGLVALGAVVTGLGVMLANPPGGNSNPTTTLTSANATPSRASAAAASDLDHFNRSSARDLVAMTDDELKAMDPLVMNMVVAKGLPDLAGIDFAKYTRVVDGWAEQIGAGLAAGEAEAALSSPAYQHDPDLWRAGGMAIALAGPRFGIAYTRDVDMANHADLFVPGLIDTKRGTCSNMPVLYMAVAHRLGWPLKAVVAADHMWCRWDDGAKQFNLEATTNVSDGQQGSFSSPPDESYRTDLRVTPKAEEVGSDLATLTARQTLGVYLQQRAGYWREKGNAEAEEADLLLAALCFPENRDICAGLMKVTDARVRRLFTPDEVARKPAGDDASIAPFIAARNAGRRAEAERMRQQVMEMNRIEQERQRRRQQKLIPPG